MNCSRSHIFPSLFWTELNTIYLKSPDGWPRNVEVVHRWERGKGQRETAEGAMRWYDFFKRNINERKKLKDYNKILFFPFSCWSGQTHIDTMRYDTRVCLVRPTFRSRECLLCLALILWDWHGSYPPKTNWIFPPLPLTVVILDLRLF